jgi:hypothetical protein
MWNLEFVLKLLALVLMVYTCLMLHDKPFMSSRIASERNRFAKSHDAGVSNYRLCTALWTKPVRTMNLLK